MIKNIIMTNTDDVSVNQSSYSIKHKSLITISTPQKSSIDSGYSIPNSTISNALSKLSHVSKVSSSFNHSSSDLNTLQNISNVQLFKINKYTLDNNRRKLEDITNISESDVNYLPTYQESFSSKKIKLSHDMQLNFQINKCPKYDNGKFLEKKKFTPYQNFGHKHISVEGQENVDIVYFLVKRYNLELITEKIFSFLSGSDIISMSIVSKIWFSAIQKSPVAQNQKQMYLKLSKENHDGLHGRKCSILNNKEYLAVISNIMHSPSKRELRQKSPPVSPNNYRFHVFLKEAKKLTFDQQLVPCPRCTRPASWSPTQTTRAECRGFHCKFVFCKSCLCEYSNNEHECLSVPRLSISSNLCRSKITNLTKKKYNLRRL